MSKSFLGVSEHRQCKFVTQPASEYTHIETYIRVDLPRFRRENLRKWTPLNQPDWHFSSDTEYELSISMKIYQSPRYCYMAKTHRVEVS